jgi:hypothetical protein
VSFLSFQNSSFPCHCCAIHSLGQGEGRIQSNLQHHRQSVPASSTMAFMPPSLHLFAIAILFSLSITCFLDLMPSVVSDTRIASTLLSALYSSAAVAGTFFIPALASHTARPRDLHCLQLICLLLGTIPFVVLHLDPLLPSLSMAAAAYTLFGPVLSLLESAHLASLMDSAVSSPSKQQSFLPLRRFVMGRQGLGLILHGLILAITLWASSSPASEVAAEDGRDISHETGAWLLSLSSLLQRGEMSQRWRQRHPTSSSSSPWHQSTISSSSAFLGKILLPQVAWRTLLGFGLIACGVATLLKVLLILFATTDEAEEEPREKAFKVEGQISAVAGDEKGGKSDSVFRHPSCHHRQLLLCLLGGLRLYVEDGHMALLMPMAAFLGMQNGFMVLNFLKVSWKDRQPTVFAFGLSAKLMPKALELLFALPTPPLLLIFLLTGFPCHIK